MVALTAGLSSCAIDDDVVDAIDDVSSAEQELVGGTFTNARPEIGQLGGVPFTCTGTLVDPRFVVTAAHCIRYTNANVGGTFTITSKSGATRSYGVDRTFALGAGDPNYLPSGAGATDVALVRLSTSVPAADADPTYIWPSWPGVGTQQTTFGYGCQNRATGTGGGAKQYFTWLAGQTSSVTCPGDSGGPVVWYGPTGGGPVFAVNSGYNSSGDMFGDAAYAIAGLEGVKRFSDAYWTNAMTTQSFAFWVSQPGVKAVAGDFDGNGTTDIALTGGPGWTSIPVAFSNGDGTFNITNYGVELFPGWAQIATQVVAGDFNGDGRADIALAGGPGWMTMPIAWSYGNGTFGVSNADSPVLAGLAQDFGAKLLAGDFDNDGRTDLALTGGLTWDSIPVGFSYGNGTFRTTNKKNAQFAAWARTGLSWWNPGVTPTVGDFNGDGAADIALTGGSGWTTIPVATSDRSGGFTNTNQGVPHFPNEWAQTGAKVIAGDFDGDRKTDLALTGGEGFLTIAFALSQGGGNFTAGNLPINNFPQWSREARFVLSGSFKFRWSSGGDGKRDIAILGGPGWGSIPVAFLRY